MFSGDDGTTSTLDALSLQTDVAKMADGEVRVTLDSETERRLKAAAAAAGRSMDEYARSLIVDALDDDHWTEDLRIADEAERTGAFHSVEEAMAHFRSALHAQVKSRP